mmetsp:Transcript_72534/g.193833  ORF Transcript_72534/g.193833 Transcript_72534/m.193833 type:complete len:159 (-) Transcript_72534:144-620(-)
MKDGQQIFTPREEELQASLIDGRTRPATIATARRHNEKDFRSISQFTPRYVALVICLCSAISLEVLLIPLTQDKKVLRYFGYFEELLDPSIIGSAPVDSAARKNVRVRNCTLLFFLDDNTIMVEEKRQDNSGMMQVLKHCARCLGRSSVIAGCAPCRP